MKYEIKIGTRVRYAREFLRNTGQQTGEAPFLRGVVSAVHTYGVLKLAYVFWDGDDKEHHINIKNLVAEDRVHLEAV